MSAGLLVTLLRRPLGQAPVVERAVAHCKRDPASQSNCRQRASGQIDRSDQLKIRSAQRSATPKSLRSRKPEQLTSPAKLTSACRSSGCCGLRLARLAMKPKPEQTARPERECDDDASVDGAPGEGCLLPQQAQCLHFPKKPMIGLRSCLNLVFSFPNSGRQREMRGQKSGQDYFR